jgi:hypothetical protein
MLSILHFRACVCLSVVCRVLQASSWVEQEQLDERLTEMESQKAQLAADLQATQVNTSFGMPAQRSAGHAPFGSSLCPYSHI